MKFKKMFEVLTDLFSDSTLHGIPRLFKSKSILAKLMWMLCFVGSTSFCIYLIFIAVCDFFDYETVTDIVYGNEIPTPFPVKTICNKNQFQNKIPLLKTIEDQYNNFDSYLTNLFILNAMLGFNETVKQSISYSLNETLIKCRFNNINCVSSDFKWTYVPFAGNCFSFSYDLTENLKKSSVEGKSSGFFIELFIGDIKLLPSYV